MSAGSILGALVAMAAVFAVARQGGSIAPTQLILCGVVMAAFFEAITSFLMFRGPGQGGRAPAGTFGLPAITKMGNGHGRRAIRHGQAATAGRATTAVP